jgi:hypothetical protein
VLFAGGRSFFFVFLFAKERSNIYLCGACEDARHIDYDERTYYIFDKAKSLLRISFRSRLFFVLYNKIKVSLKIG